MGDERRAHVERVAALATSWAEAMRVADSERRRWLKAVWLHDALRDADPPELVRWAGQGEVVTELLHGPAAANRAAAEGETDQGVLDAVRYHSVGSPSWDLVGRVLYCADFLEPGRRFEQAERAALAGRFPNEPEAVFHEVVARRIVRLIQEGWSVPDSTHRLWNRLARSRSDVSL
jgi:2-amino-4-hydroxy-6-hydroxymethyldihydropteridine diphosphokinase